MDKKTILREALHLRPAERLQLIELLTQSLSKPDKKIDRVWAEESEKRYNALKEGRVKSIPIKDVIERYK